MSPEMTTSLMLSAVSATFCIFRKYMYFLRTAPDGTSTQLRLLASAITKTRRVSGFSRKSASARFSSALYVSLSWLFSVLTLFP